MTKNNFSEVPSALESVASLILEAIKDGEVVCLRGETKRGMVSVARAAASFLGPGVPFRAPHYTISIEALMGGRRPGEISHAKGGVLMLDEADRFSRTALALVASAVRDGKIPFWNGSERLVPALVILTVTGEGPDMGFLDPFRRREVPVRTIQMPSAELYVEGAFCSSTEEILGAVRFNRILGAVRGCDSEAVDWSLYWEGYTKGTHYGGPVLVDYAGEVKTWGVVGVTRFLVDHWPDFVE